jgi:N-acetyltransferase
MPRHHAAAEEKIAVFALQPILRDDVLQVRPATSEDWTAMFAVASDPLIWEIHPAHDRYQERVFRDFFSDGMASGGMLVVQDKASGAIIGSSRYNGYEADRSAIEIGWTFLARSHWGGAYNRALKRLMLRHAFHYVETVDFVVGEHNLRSRRAMEKIGGLLTNRSTERLLGGEIKRNVIYEIRKADFFASSLHLEAATGASLLQ